MSNLLNGLSLTAIAEESLPVLQKVVPPLEAFYSDFSKDTAAAYSAISTRYPTAVTSSYYTRTAGYTAQDATSSAVTVTLGDVLHSVSSFTDYEVSTITLPRLVNTFLQGNMYAVVNAMYNQATANIKSATYSSAYTGSTFTFDNYYDVVTALKTAGVSTPKSVVLNSAYFGKLLKDIKQNYVIGTSDVIRGGTIGQLGGAQVFESPGLNNNGEGLVGFGVGKEFATIATRLPVISVATGIEEVESVVEPETGLTLQLRASRNPWNGLTYVGYYVLQGVAQGNPSACWRITDGTHA